MGLRFPLPNHGANPTLYAKVGCRGLTTLVSLLLFNALLQNKLAYAANFPFATIEPNIGWKLEGAEDERLKLAEVEKSPFKVVSATIEFVDITGRLVKEGPQKRGGAGQ